MHLPKRLILVLAQTCYALVDRHINRLDSDARRADDAIALGIREGTMVSAEAPSLASVGAGGLGKEGRKKRGAVGCWLPPVVDMRGVLPSEPKYVSISERLGLAISKGKADELQVLLLQSSIIRRGTSL